jgi:hypothetical protein
LDPRLGDEALLLHHGLELDVADPHRF